jgi:hypothetical protein
MWEVEVRGTIEEKGSRRRYGFASFNETSLWPTLSW